MRGMRRLCGAVVVAAALSGVTATSAMALAAPACSTRLVLAEAGTTASCGYDAQWDYANITVEPIVGTVQVTVRCTTYWGATYTTLNQTVYEARNFRAYSPGSCTLTLTAGSFGVTANASATPTTAPIIDPPPPVLP